MSSQEPSSPKLTISELAQLLSPAIQAPKGAEGATASWKDRVWVTRPDGNDDKRFVWVTQPDNTKNNDHQQMPVVTNGTYSEALTRLQSGYLRAIAVLEEHNKALQQELNIAHETASGRLALANFNATQRISSLEDENAILQLELDAALSKPNPLRAKISQLYTALAAKNTTIEEKNSRIVHIERTNRRLQEELVAERQRNRNTTGIRVGGNDDGPSRMTHLSQKKRKHTDLVHEEGSLDNPLVNE